MAEAGNPATPASMTLMAGPVDTRINPTKVNALAESHSIAWFEQNLISAVPRGLKGAGRRVYPGFLQTAAFVTMNSERHEKAHRDMFFHLAKGEKDKADIIKTFYDEYFAVLDLPAEFLFGNRREGFSGRTARAGNVDLPRPARGPQEDPAHGAADSRG